MKPNLGFGLGLRPVHYPDLLQGNRWPIDWFEVISENFMGVGGRPRQVLERLRADYPFACHGVGLSIAGADPLDPAYLKRLRDLLHWLEPALVTDHLCWTSSHGHHTYDLLPFPLTRQSLEHIVARIAAVQDYLGRTMLFENPSCYIDFAASSWSEPDFLAELCRQTGCGLLLDLNNCMVNSRNLGWQPREYLERLRPEWVQQFHLAGHSVYDHISIDTHDHPVPEAVWTFYEQASQRFPEAAVLIEWDEKIPPLKRMLEELDIARDRYDRGAKQIPLDSERVGQPPRIEVEDWTEQAQQLFRHIVDPLAPESPGVVCRSTPVATQYGLKVYRDGYFIRARETLGACFPALAYILEPQLFAKLVEEFLIHVRPTHYSINYLGQTFAPFLASHPLPYSFGTDQSAIAQLAALDWADYELKIRADDPAPRLDARTLSAWTGEDWADKNLRLRRECALLVQDWRLLDAWSEIRAGRTPPPPTRGREWLVLERSMGEVQVEAVTEQAFLWYQQLAEGAQLADLLAEAAEPVELTVKELMVFLLQLSERGLLTTVDPAS